MSDRVKHHLWSGRHGEKSSEKKIRKNLEIRLTLSATAPWDVIDSRGGVQSARICKTSLNHHLTMKFCIYPQDVFRTRL